MKKIKLELNKDDFKKKLDIQNGKDGKTPTKKELIDIIKPLIPEPKKEVIIEKTEVIKEQPIIKEIENKETGASIVDKINELRTDRSQYKIDASHIKNLPKATEQILQRFGSQGDMQKSVYDPAGGNKQVAFADELNQLEDLAIAYAVAL